MEDSANGPNILIVDDEIGPRESLRMILKPNYNVFTAENGYNAIQMVRETEFDVITLDLKMPGMSGIDAFKEIRKVDPDVIVIIITGYGTLQSAIEAIRYGVSDYLSKPFNVPEIMSIFEKSVQRRRLNLKIKGLLKSMSDPSHYQEMRTGLEMLPYNGIEKIADPQGDSMGSLDFQTFLEFRRSGLF